MKAKIEDLEKEQLLEMVKALWIERALKDLDSKFEKYEFKKELAYEELILEIAFNFDENVLKYFGYDV